jgi:hypothetical protein
VASPSGGVINRAASAKHIEANTHRFVVGFLFKTTMTMSTSAIEINSETHNFIAHISAISFDFSGQDWKEEFESKQEWIDYQAELSKEYSTFSINFIDYDLPDSDEEDETLEEFYESTHCAGEGYYYRILESWIDENIGWCIRDIEYKIVKV